MVFNVSIPHERDTTPEQLDVLKRLGQHVISTDGRTGRYRPVRVGDTLLTTLNARNAAQARRKVADAVGRDPAELVATSRESGDRTQRMARAAQARRGLTARQRSPRD